MADALPWMRWWHGGPLLAIVGAFLLLQIAELPGDECSTGTTRYTSGNPLCIDSSTPRGYSIR